MEVDKRLTRRDTKPIPVAPNEIRLFCKFRNEAMRLPFFLEHHRKLGVSRFFFVDNDSSDESAEFLTSQSDCHIFWTDEKMNEARAGMAWLEPLLNAYGNGQWCLIADADELFIYLDVESVSISQFCSGLEKQGANALICMMLDMYPDGSQKEIQYRKGQSFLEVSPFFDKSGYLYRIKKEQGSVPEIVGGPRLRMFFPELLDRRFHIRLKRRIRSDLAYASIFRKTSLSKLKPPAADPLNKVPLVKWDSKSKLSFSSAGHILYGGSFGANRGILLHFKFLGDFSEKVKEELVRRAYDGNAQKYERYAARLDEKKVPLNFMCELSTRYIGTQQLLKLGLLRQQIDNVNK